MAFDFPASPTVGQAFNGWVWDGEKWQMQGSAAQGAVRYDIAQGLTSAQQTQARANVYAAPLDALAYNGMQINGSMEVSQENGTASVAVGAGTVSKYVVDGWTVSKTGTSVLSAYQLAPGAPGGTTGLAGLPFGIQLHATTAQPSIGSDSVTFTCPIEGTRISRAAWGTASASPITVGFWARMSLVGNYFVQISNNVDAATPGTPFAIAQSLVWQWVTVTFAGITTGTWKTDNTKAGQLNIVVASNLTPNMVGATNQYAAITGVVVLPGIEAPSAARSPLIMRPYDQELITCQRYWQCSDTDNPKGSATGAIMLIATATDRGGFSYQFGVNMRAVPSFTLWQNGTQNKLFDANTGAQAGPSAFNVNIVGKRSMSGVYVVAGLTPAHHYYFDLQLDARL